MQPLAPALQRRLQQVQAKTPQLSQQEQARAVLATYVAAEEEIEESQQPPPPRLRQHAPTRLPSSSKGKGKPTLVSAPRPQPQPFPSNSHNRKRKSPPPAPSIVAASQLKKAPKTTAAATAASAAVPLKGVDPALAKYEAEDEEEQNGGCPGVSAERRRKVVRELVLAAKDAGIKEATALARAREEEGGWFRRAGSKQEYQSLCRATLESMY